MPTHTVQYASQSGLGDAAACAAAMAEIAAAISDWNNRLGRSVNFSIQILYSSAHAEDELIDSEKLRRSTRSIYPVVWLRLVYDPTKLPSEQLEAWERQFNLSPLVRGSLNLDLLGLGTSPSERAE